MLYVARSFLAKMFDIVFQSESFVFLGKCEVESSCTCLKYNKLCGGTAAFQIETGRWHGVKIEDRIHKECESGEMEDETHWLLRCEAWNEKRIGLIQALREDTRVRGLDDDIKAASILSDACLNHHICTLTYTQFHYPSDPLQPGPIYFLTCCKCSVFGVCCEGIPLQVNFLMDKAADGGKGAYAVVSRIHYYFKNYGLGEEEASLHADNCAGQNKKTSDLSLKNSWAAYGPGNLNRLEIVIID